MQFPRGNHVTGSSTVVTWLAWWCYCKSQTCVSKIISEDSLREKCLHGKRKIRMKLQMEWCVSAYPRKFFFWANLLEFGLFDAVMHLSSASPRGGDPGLMWGNTGTLWGLCNKFLPLWWGKCGDFDFWIPYSREECGDFASVQLRWDKERSIVCLIHGKMVEEKKKISSKVHCFFCLSNRPPKRPSKICTYL